MPIFSGLTQCLKNDGKPLANNRKDGTLGLNGIPSSRLIAESMAMSWKDRAIELCKRYGAPAKFAAKTILGAVLPGSPVVVELVSEILDPLAATANDLAPLMAAMSSSLPFQNDVNQ